MSVPLPCTPDGGAADDISRRRHTMLEACVGLELHETPESPFSPGMMSLHNDMVDSLIDAIKRQQEEEDEEDNSTIKSGVSWCSSRTGEDSSDDDMSCEEERLTEQVGKLRKYMGAVKPHASPAASSDVSHLTGTTQQSSASSARRALRPPTRGSMSSTRSAPQPAAAHVPPPAPSVSTTPAAPRRTQTPDERAAALLLYRLAKASRKGPGGKPAMLSQLQRLQQQQLLDRAAKAAAAMSAPAAQPSKNNTPTSQATPPEAVGKQRMGSQGSGGSGGRRGVRGEGSAAGGVGGNKGGSQLSVAVGGVSPAALAAAGGCGRSSFSSPAAAAAQEHRLDLSADLEACKEGVGKLGMVAQGKGGLRVVALVAGGALAGAATVLVALLFVNGGSFTSPVSPSSPALVVEQSLLPSPPVLSVPSTASVVATPQAIVAAPVLVSPLILEAIAMASSDGAEDMLVVHGEGVCTGSGCSKPLWQRVWQRLFADVQRRTQAIKEGREVEADFEMRALSWTFE